METQKEKDFYKLMQMQCGSWHLSEESWEELWGFWQETDETLEEFIEAYKRGDLI